MKKILIILLMFLCQSATFAIEDVKKVDLEEAMNSAIKNNIDLQAAQIDITIAKNNIKAANRLQNPSFDAFYNLSLIHI